LEGISLERRRVAPQQTLDREERNKPQNGQVFIKTNDGLGPAGSLFGLYSELLEVLLAHIDQRLSK
jgi:hypothetical protein